MIISPNVIANTSNVNSELDHCTMTVTLKSEKVRSESRNIFRKLYHEANWSKMNENMKTKLSKLSGISDVIKKQPKKEIKLFLDELTDKLMRCTMRFKIIFQK